MEKYKEIIKKRLTYMGLFNLAAVLSIVLTAKCYPTADEGTLIDGFVRGFQVGIFACLQVMFLIATTRYARGLRDEEKLRKLYIAEKDERRKFIQDKIGGIGFNFTLALIALATVIAGFFHLLVFLTLLAVIFLMTLVKGSLKVYYKNKF